MTYALTPSNLAGPSYDNVRRETAAANVSVAIHQANKILTAMLDGNLSILNNLMQSSVAAPLATFIKRQGVRNAVSRAREQLLGPFQESALNAIRDQSRDLGATLENIRDYFTQLMGQIQAIASVEERTSARAFFADVEKQFWALLAKGVSSAVTHLPVWAWVALGVVGVSYIAYNAALWRAIMR